jgi:hypothetical protein
VNVDALFELTGARYTPTERALGPWGKRRLHGGPVAALLAHVVETHAAGDGLLAVRLSVDLFRAVPMAPMDVEVHTLRRGSRLHVVAATLLQDGAVVSHGVGLRLRRSAEPAVALSQSNPQMKPPATFEQIPVVPEPISHATSLELRGRLVHDDAGLWVRAKCPVVAGCDLTPFERAAIVSDWMNPVANYGPEGINFINTDITLHLFREPRGEWLGLQPAARHSCEGIALSDGTMHDLDGPVGRCVTASLATQAMASVRRPSGG